MMEKISSKWVEELKNPQVGNKSLGLGENLQFS
jgi:hypothetical protein